jgi:hypothetical protein
MARGTFQRYLVEAYHSAVSTERLTESARRARATARDVTDEGQPVRYLRATFVPEDELCLYSYEAVSRNAVEKASRRAGIGPGRIVEALHVGSVAIGRGRR